MGIKLTKQDYMRLSKERLAELLAERDAQQPIQIPTMPQQPSGLVCDGTHCINPFHDCINCPTRFSTGGTISRPNSYE